MIQTEETAILSSAIRCFLEPIIREVVTKAVEEAFEEMSKKNR